MILNMLIVRKSHEEAAMHLNSLKHGESLLNENLSPGTHIRLFADDSLLYRVINNILILLFSKKTLTKFKMGDSYKMEFHPGKCQILRITNKRQQFLEPPTNVNL